MNLTATHLLLLTRRLSRMPRRDYNPSLRLECFWWLAFGVLGTVIIVGVLAL